MNNNRRRIILLLLVLCIAACAATVVIRESGGGKENTVTEGTEPTPMGEGKNLFLLSVVDGNQQETLLEIHTDENLLGSALQKLDLIGGDDGPYGLYITSVNGITARYEEDGSWWCLYIRENGSDDYVMATTGVDAAELTEGRSYRLKVEK